MSGRKAFVALAVTTALGILGAAPAAAGSDRDRGRDRYGSVVPCSLDGVNPAFWMACVASAQSACAPQ
jgi:hypothetical protein